MNMRLLLCACTSVGFMSMALGVKADNGGFGVECTGTSGPEKRAEKELHRWIGEISEVPPPVRFRLGVADLELFPEDKAFLGDSDGYAVRMKDGVIYIVSPQPRGVLYGVYDFLERNSDIIWARPEESCGTMFTRVKMFSVKNADFRERPEFQMRGWWLCGPHRDIASEYWHARVKCNFGCASMGRPEVRQRAVECGFMIGGAQGHNLPGLMPDEVYDSHPEYFTMISGVRRRDSRNTQFCFSNLDGAKVIGKTAVEQIAKKRAEWKEHFDHWALKQADNQRNCECEACSAPIVLPDGRVSRKGDPNFLSNRTFLYLNEAIKPIVEAYPDLRVDTFAYQFTAPPPDVKVHPKFNVSYCPFIKNDRFPVTNEINAVWQTRSEQWSKATKNIMWREYWGCASAFPRQHSLVAVHDLRWIRSALGFSRVYSETVPDCRTRRTDYRPRWDASAMEHWVISRLMWNPFRPIEEYRDEFITKAYRKAAAPMRRFYAMIAESWFSDSAMSNYRDDPYGNSARYFVRAGISGKLLACLDEAERLAADEIPATKELIRRQKMHFKDLIDNAGKVEEPLVVPCVKDGDESRAQKIRGFHIVSGSRKAKLIPAHAESSVLIWHDQKDLHVKFLCWGVPPEKLEAKEKDNSGREFFPGGDHVEFVLVTDKGVNVHHFAVDVNNNRYDTRNSKASWNAQWETSAKKEKDHYEIVMKINLESLKIELTKDNRFSAAFARMAPHGGVEGRKEFSSWNAVHPQAISAFGDIFLNME